MITVAAVILAVGALVFTVMVRAGDVLEAEPSAPSNPDEERLAALEESLRDLEFEQRVGKLSEADYQQTRQDLEREMAQLQARIGGGVTQPAVEARVATALVCPHCGASFPTALKFCGECGRPMRRNTP